MLADRSVRRKFDGDFSNLFTQFSSVTMGFCLVPSACHRTPSNSNKARDSGRLNHTRGTRRIFSICILNIYHFNELNIPHFRSRRERVYTFNTYAKRRTLGRLGSAATLQRICIYLPRKCMSSLKPNLRSLNILCDGCRAITDICL